MATPYTDGVRALAEMDRVSEVISDVLIDCANQIDRMDQIAGQMFRENETLQSQLTSLTEALGEATHELEAFHRCIVDDSTRAEIGALIVKCRAALSNIRGQAK